MDKGDTQSFLFHIPVVSNHVSAGAAIAIQMGGIASRLVSEKRTRCVHPNGRAENDAEHSLMLAKVAPELANLLYPELDENLVARFASLHDDVEAYVGDTPTDILANLDPEAKALREAEGLKRLLKEYSHLPSYCLRLKEYDAQVLPEARFVRAVDKLMVLLIQLPNEGAVLRTHYTYETFLEYEKKLLQRDRYKYGGFKLISELRLELGQLIANQYLADKRKTI